ncbi:MAG: RNA polymerase sigma factor [Bacteroidota bacterium]
MYPSSEETFERIRQAYDDELRAFVMARVGEDEADDLLQEVWSAFARYRLDMEIEQPRAWLFKAVRNRMADRFRAHARRPAFVAIDEADRFMEAEPDAFDTDAFWDRFDAALETLPETQAEVFVRNELEGETLREIAESQGEKLKTIISRKQYAKQRLRAELQDWYDEFFTN